MVGETQDLTIRSLGSIQVTLEQIAALDRQMRDVKARLQRLEQKA